ncbi:MAG: DHA2 family efflux MFS transporter permease subunit [Syntrophorhabdaceae bacterium]
MSEKSRTFAFFLIVISVAFASFLVRLNNYMVNVSLPTITRTFGITSAEASQVISSFLLIITTTLLLFGKIGDRIGLKKVFIAGYAVFTAGSLLCGLSQNITMLIGARVIQGIGSSMLLAVSFAIISHYLPQGKTGWAFGITSTASALGVATGAPLGGIVTGYLSWNWAFFINIPFGIAAIAVASRCIPRAEKKEDRHAAHSRFDLPGAVLSFTGLGLLLWGFNRADDKGWLSPVIIGCLVLALVILCFFVWWEGRHPNPLLDIRLFRNPAYTFALVAAFFAYMLISGNAFLLPFYLDIIKGLNAQTTGMVLLSYSAIYVCLSPIAGRLSDKIRPIILCSIATASATICVLVFSLSLSNAGFGIVFLYLIWLALSFVFFFSPNNNQVMNYAPADKKGVSSGLFNTTTNLGMVFGVTVIEAVFSAASNSGASLKALSVSDALAGFRFAYIAGAACCGVAFVFSLLGYHRVKRS